MSFSVIQGSSSGIGLALVKHLLTQTDHRVVALSRQPRRVLEQVHESPELLSRWQERRCQALEVNSTSEESMAAAADSVRQHLDPKDQLYALINVSGILHVEKSLQQMTYATALETFQVNTLGHLFTYKHFLPLLSKKRPSVLPPARFISLSARTGSIEDNKSGGWYSYRSSKAATNQVIRTLSHEINYRHLPAIAAAIHPGTVRTQLSEGLTNHLAPSHRILTPEEASHHLWQVVQSLGPDQHGGFLDWQGKPIPW